MTAPNPMDDPRLTAAVELINRTGASAFQMRYCDTDLPVVWIAIATYSADRLQRLGRAPTKPADELHECAGAMDPLTAVFRLCAQLIDGGTCTHCSRPAGFSEDVEPLPLDTEFCWYQWDPELATFRRACEGEAA